MKVYNIYSIIVTDSNVPDYDDLFSTDCDKVKTIGRIITQKFNCLVTNYRAQLGSHQASAAT